MWDSNPSVAESGKAKGRNSGPPMSHPDYECNSKNMSLCAEDGDSYSENNIVFIIQCRSEIEKRKGKDKSPNAK